jgi:isochorismate pyruvate lyase
MEDLSNRVRAELGARTAPERCGVMPEVRAGVDALDRALVLLMAERVRYMDAAARIKPERQAVRDEDRIEDVVAKVLATSDREGLPAAVAEPVWRLLIERCIAHEFDVFDSLRREAST